jgi:mannose-1-phosphate guanylyltransferase
MKTGKSKRVAVIMAGGSGERFWPLSRKSKPKQLLRLANPDESLLSEAVARLAKKIPDTDIFIATARHLCKSIENAQLPIPSDNILAEPCKRNTSGCLYFVAANMLARFGDEAESITLAIVTADQEIKNAPLFLETVETALDAAEKADALVTIGIFPSRPETGYGYIEMVTDQGPIAGSTEENAVFPVVRFVEKPDSESVRRFLATGHYLWNSGMFFWRLETFMNELKKVQPEAEQKIRDMAAALKANDQNTVDEIFATLPDISIDYALMERASKVLVAPGDFHWDDVGAWDALDRNFPQDEQGNVAIGDPVLVDVENSIVYNDSGAEKIAVGVVGMRDVVVVVSDDGILVAPKAKAQDVKAVVRELKKRNAKQL